MTKKRWFMMSLIVVQLFALSTITAKEKVEYSQVIDMNQKVDKAGTYFVKIYVDEESFQYIRVHVRYPKTILDYSRKEGIDAHDIVLEKGGLSLLNESHIFNLSGVHAWSLEDGKEVPITSITLKDGKEGTTAVRDVTYATDSGLSLTVSIYEQSEVNLGLEEVYVNQNAVVNNRLRYITLLGLALVVLPTLIYLLIFWYLNRVNRNIIDLLYKEKDRD